MDIHDAYPDGENDETDDKICYSRPFSHFDCGRPCVVHPLPAVFAMGVRSSHRGWQVSVIWFVRFFLVITTSWTRPSGLRGLHGSRESVSGWRWGGFGGFRPIVSDLLSGLSLLCCGPSAVQSNCGNDYNGQLVDCFGTL